MVMSGEKDPEEAWRLPEETYWDKLIAILLAMQKLESVRLRLDLVQNKVEAVVLILFVDCCCRKRFSAISESILFSVCHDLKSRPLNFNGNKRLV